MTEDIDNYELILHILQNIPQFHGDAWRKVYSRPCTFLLFFKLFYFQQKLERIGLKKLISYPFKGIKHLNFNKKYFRKAIDDGEQSELNYGGFFDHVNDDFELIL